MFVQKKNPKEQYVLEQTYFMALYFELAAFFEQEVSLNVKEELSKLKEIDLVGQVAKDNV